MVAHLRPDARIGIERPEPDRHLARVGLALAEERRPAARAEELRPAVGRPVRCARAPRPARSAGCRARSGPGQRRPCRYGAGSACSGSSSPTRAGGDLVAHAAAQAAAGDREGRFGHGRDSSGWPEQRGPSPSGARPRWFQAVSRSSSGSASGSTRVRAAGASERRKSTTPACVRAHGRSVFHVSTCSGTWKSPLATAGRPAAGDPGEHPMAVDQLEAVRERAQLRVAPEPARRAAGDRVRNGAVRMGGDQRGARLPRLLHRGADPAFDRDEPLQPHRDRVGAARAVGRIVVGQLEAGDDKHPVERLGPRGLLADRGEVRGVALLGDHLAAADHVVGDAEDVESATAVQVDDLLERQVAVAPCRVGMELAQKRRLHAREW